MGLAGELSDDASAGARHLAVSLAPLTHSARSRLGEFACSPSRELATIGWAEGARTRRTALETDQLDFLQVRAASQGSKVHILSRRHFQGVPDGSGWPPVTKSVEPSVRVAGVGRRGGHCRSRRARTALLRLSSDRDLTGDKPRIDLYAEAPSGARLAWVAVVLPAGRRSTRELQLGYSSSNREWSVTCGG